MPNHLCPTCKAWLLGDVKNGVFCRYCGYEKAGHKEVKKEKKKK